MQHLSCHIKKQLLSLVLLGCVLTLPAYATTCYITLAKDSCWKMYDVKVDVLDASTNKQLVSVEVPMGSNEKRVSFECSLHETLTMNAQFSPVFWAKDEGKVFSAERYLQLPETMKKGEVAWELQVCFPKMFANVPMPPEATAHCECQFETNQ